MNPKSAPRGPYLRPMAGWWRRNPFFIRYMAREATALAVAAYALILTVGVFSLARGEAAWNAWLTALRSPVSVALHGLLLAALVLHTKSWFEIMPKTLPMIFIGPARLQARTVTRIGWAACVVVSVLLALLAWTWRS